MNNKKILVVDDDTTNRRLIKILLSKKPGIEIIEADNGLDALNKLTDDVSLILLDIYMPVMNGIKFLQDLRMEKPELANIPVIILSTDDTKKQEALSWGANDFIIKPVNPVNLWEKVSQYLY